MREDFRPPKRRESPRRSLLPYCSLLYYSNFLIVIYSFAIIPSVRGLPSTNPNNNHQIFSFLERRPNENSQREAAAAAVFPPHCSKAIISASQSSRLTRRSTSPWTQQMSLNINVGQTVCFRLDDQTEADTEKGDSAERTESAERMTQKAPTGPSDSRRRVRPLYKNYAALKGRRNLNLHPRDLDSSAPLNLNNSNENDENRTIRPGANERDKDHKSYSNENLLHTVTVVELEQYYAIKERYKFAIPELETKCICECNPLAATCQADEWKYGECLQTANTYLDGGRVVPGACHRTFFPNQPSGSCASAESLSSSRLCCQLRFRAYQNRVFTAIWLEPMSSHAILKYTIYKYQTANTDNSSNAESQKKDNSNSDDSPWLVRDERWIRVQLNGMLHNSVLDVNTGLKLSILGLGANSGSVKLEPGMYYVENLGKNQFSEISSQPINRITEHDFHKLGWLRVSDATGAAFVQSGDIFFDKIHHAKTSNCAEQNFRSVLDASYYFNADEQSNNSTTEFRLADPLYIENTWIRSARVVETSSLRQAVVRAVKGVNLDVTLTIPPNEVVYEDSDLARSSTHSNGWNKRGRSSRRRRHPLITFVHNSSRIDDFNGLIYVDRYSNSFLNLTLYNGKGVLNGYVRQLNDTEGENIDTISLAVPQQPHTIRMINGKQVTLTTVVERIKPYPVNNLQVVCLRPDDGDSVEQCREILSVEFDLEVNTVRNDWSFRIGSCPECNKISVEGFLKYMNPFNWVKGIKSVTDGLMLASDLVVYAVVFFILYYFITKIVIPVGRCCLCPTQLFYSKSKALMKLRASKASKCSRIKLENEARCREDSNNNNNKVGTYSWSSLSTQF